MPIRGARPRNALERALTNNKRASYRRTARKEASHIHPRAANGFHGRERVKGDRVRQFSILADLGQQKGTY
jgi:hypothetical protein